MANSIVTRGLGPPGSIPEFILRGLNPSSVAAMVASVIGGQGSVGQIAGTGSTQSGNSDFDIGYLWDSTADWDLGGPEGIAGTGSAGVLSGSGGV